MLTASQKFSPSLLAKVDNFPDYLEQWTKQFSNKNKPWTPYTLTHKMFNAVTHEGTIAIIGCIALLDESKNKNYSSIFFIPSSTEQRSAANKYAARFSNITIAKDDISAFINKNAWSHMKFDTIIGNPPYIKNFHMKVLNVAKNALKDDGNLVFVHPAGEFVAFKNPARSKFVRNIANEIVELNFINGNYHFDDKPRFFVPLSITHIRKGYDNNNIITVRDECAGEIKVYHYNGFAEVNVHGQRPEVYSLHAKFKAYPKKLVHYLNDASRSSLGYYVSFIGFRGNISKDTSKLHSDDFFTIVHDGIIVQRGICTKGQHVYFGSAVEASNYLKFLKTNFARRLVSLYKTNQHLDSGELNLLPWLDFTEEWTDEKLAVFFNLTENEVNFINEIPKFHGLTEVFIDAFAVDENDEINYVTEELPAMKLNTNAGVNEFEFNAMKLVMSNP